MDIHGKAFELFWKLYNENYNFSKIIDNNFEKGKIRFFNDIEWNKIKQQNFIPYQDQEINEFIDMFLLGYNIGNCVGTSIQLSFSYNKVDIVSGILPILKGTLNAEKEGGHCWLETPESIIDTTLMLVIDKSLKSDLGYIEEQRRTYKDLSNSSRYLARKKFVIAKDLNTGKKVGNS